MNWKGFSSGSGLILRCYPGIRLEGLRKTTKTSIRIAGRQGRESSPGPPEQEAGVLTTIPQCPVRAFWDIAPCSLVEVDSFRGEYCLNQGDSSPRKLSSYSPQ
jgi:hypothetical protein